MIALKQRLQLLDHESWSKIVYLHHHIMLLLAGFPTPLGNDDASVVDKQIDRLIAF